MGNKKWFAIQKGVGLDESTRLTYHHTALQRAERTFYKLCLTNDFYCVPNNKELPAEQVHADVEQRQATDGISFLVDLLKNQAGLILSSGEYINALSNLTGVTCIYARMDPAHMSDIGE